MRRLASLLCMRRHTKLLCMRRLASLLCMHRLANLLCMCSPAPQCVSHRISPTTGSSMIIIPATRTNPRATTAAVISSSEPKTRYAASPAFSLSETSYFRRCRPDHSTYRDSQRQNADSESHNIDNMRFHKAPLCKCMYKSAFYIDSSL